jgi:multimeric flavodoxin WrbA
MKAVALVASAREHGNCYDFARFTLERLAAQEVETELINFYDYQITPCQKCAYECMQRLDPGKGKNAPCPIQDDVRTIWEKTWQAEILLLFVPNYGGMLPASWSAFSQRQQSFFREAPTEKLKKSVVSAVVLASPHQSSGASWAPSMMSDEVKDLGRRVAAFDVINPPQFTDEYIFSGLIHNQEIRRRLEFISTCSLDAALQLAML